MNPITSEQSETRSSFRKKIGLLKTYLSGYPLWGAWQITYRCNYRCRMCHYWKDAPNPGDELTLAEITRISNRLSRLGSFLLSLAGGEPLVREDILDVVRVVASRHITFITTNGSNITPDRARTMFEAGLWGVSVSVDYADAAKHDRMRGVKGAYDRAIEAIKVYSQARVAPYQRVNVMVVLTDDNIDEFEELAKIALDLNANIMVQPYCYLKTGDKKYLPPAHVSERMLAIKRKRPNFLSNTYFLRLFDAALNGGVPGCKAGRAFFNIDNVGSVAMCVERRNQPVGNFLTEPAETIMRRLRAASRCNYCRDCWYNCRGEVESLYSAAGLARALPLYLFDSFSNFGERGKW